MKAKLLILAGALLLPLTASAQGSGWSKTFEPSATGSHLPAESRGLLVIPAGEPSAEPTAAALALEAGLRASGKARLVMGGASLGNVSALSDPEILQKAAPLPVEVVAIVRVFPGPEGTPSTAVVTLYEKKGAVIAALSAEEGTPVAARPASQPGGGISGRASVAVDEVVSKTTISTSGAQEVYDRQRIWFEDSAIVNANTGVVMSVWTHGYRGKYKEPLEGAAFYEAIERPDLAGSYRTRRAVKTSLAVTGFAGLLASPGLITYGLVSGCVKKDASTDECLERDGKLAAGIVVGSVGMVALLANLFIDSQPVEMPEMRRLVDEYNQKLKRDLGLVEKAEKSAEDDRALSWQLGGYLGPKAGGITLSFSL